MARSGYAKGINSGHVTEQRAPKAGPRRGVSVNTHHLELLSVVTLFFWGCSMLYLYIYIYTASFPTRGE